MAFQKTASAFSVHSPAYAPGNAVDNDPATYCPGGGMGYENRLLRRRSRWGSLSSAGRTRGRTSKAAR